MSRTPGSDKNAYWRQVITYWEMAASMVLRGAVDADLFLDSQGEGLFLYAKFHHWHAETEKRRAATLFMKQTATLIERFPTAKAIYEVDSRKVAGDSAKVRPSAKRQRSARPFHSATSLLQMRCRLWASRVSGEARPAFELSCKLLY